MKLWLISQETNTCYDTFDSAIVAADDETQARGINPGGPYNWDCRFSSWCKSPDEVKAEYIGEAKEGTPSGMILGSFNAG